MTIWGFLIGTLALWGLTYGVVIPIAKGLSALSKSIAGNAPGVSLLPPLPPLDGATPQPAAPLKKPDSIDSVPTGLFILVHVLVLGFAGLLLGVFAGMFFIGIAQKAKMWPGMIALILASLAGTFLFH
jgi:hypothetical protein